LNDKRLWKRAFIAPLLGKFRRQRRLKTFACPLNFQPVTAFRVAGRKNFHNIKFTSLRSSPAFPPNSLPIYILPCRFARSTLPCPFLQTPPPNLRITFCEDTLSHEIFVFLPLNKAAKASHAIEPLNAECFGYGVRGRNGSW
jgi:hypothetical protein